VYKDELLREKETSRLADPAVSQPVCTALQIALFELLSSWGITPAAVVGHSSGEVAAAYAAGGLSRGSAWKVAFYRGVVASWLAKSGREPEAMMSVSLSEAAIDPFLRQLGPEDGHISIGCINSPQNITLSGSLKQIDALATMLEREHVSVRKLKVNVAYHSQSMKEVASIYEMLIGNLKAGRLSSEMPLMYSTVTGKLIPPEELTNSEYWIRNMVSPVQFLQAVNQISSRSSRKLAKKLKASEQNIAVDYLLELGPHATLKAPLMDILKGNGTSDNVSYNSMLVRGRSAVDTALGAAGSLYCMGYPVDLARINVPDNKESPPCMLTSLPAYPWNHSRKYWIESRLSEGFRFRKFPHHELLGTPASDWNPLEARWGNTITLSENQWIKDHKVWCFLMSIQAASN
jgi:acyl transferase domain-containing protein